MKFHPLILNKPKSTLSNSPFKGGEQNLPSKGGLRGVIYSILQNSAVLIFPLIFTLSLLLTGCNVEALLGQEEGHRREPINIADWPAPVPSAVPAAPTPFPKSQLSPTLAKAETNSQPAQQPAVTIPSGDLSALATGNLAAQVATLTGGLTPVGAAFVTGEAAALQQSPASTSGVINSLPQSEAVGVLGQDTSGHWLYVITTGLEQGWLAVNLVSMVGVSTDLPILPDNQSAAVASNASTDITGQLLGNSADLGMAAVLKSGLSPAAVFNVQVKETSLRQGPGSNYGATGTVTQGDLGGVLGTNADRNWLYVLTIDKLQGWLPVEAARVLGTLDQAPVLPADPLAAFKQAALAAATGGQSSSSATTNTSNATATGLDITSLEAVATARITSDLLNLRQRPGGNFAQLGTLPGNTQVEIYGLNRDGDWALITNGEGATGWVSTDFLDVAGSLANAPQFRTLEPIAANQIAPIVSASGATGAVIAAANTSSASPPSAPASAVVSQSSATNLPGNTLAPQTTAQVHQKVDIRTGPGLNFGALHELTVDEIVTVLATNATKDWLVVRTHDSKLGWAPRDALTVAGSLDQAQSVLTALVQSNAVPVRRGPGIYYDTIGTLSINELVSVLALDKDKSWALVETLAATQGWVPARMLNVGGSLAGLPTAEAPALTVSVSPDALPPSPSGPPSGKLVVQSSSGGDIYALNADGSGLRYLTTGIDPVLSPDGSQIAFTRWDGAIGTLWVMNLDGSGERAVLGEMTKAKGSDWSPDGTQIVLNFQQGGRVEASRACRDFGTEPPRNAINIRIDRKPDGEMKICWTDPPDPHWTIRTINVADGSFADRDGGLYAFRPAWDPAQPWRIVSDSGSGLVAFDINREEYRQELSQLAGDGSPAISPDGRFMAIATQINNNHEIFRTNTDGSGRVRLTQTPLWETVKPGTTPKLWNNVAPVWSPDGSQIAFVTDRSGPWEIWVMNADGANPRPMLPTEIQEQLNLNYNFVDERTISWR